MSGKQWIKMAKSFGYEVQAVFFDVPLAVCMERNSKRDRQVTDEVMHKMAERLKPPTFKEGFDKITVVRVKGAAGDGPRGGGCERSAAVETPPVDAGAADRREQTACRQSEERVSSRRRAWSCAEVG